MCWSHTGYRHSTSCFMCWSPTGYSLLCRARLASCADHLQATACWAQHVLLHVLVTYRLQLAGQSTSCFMCWSQTGYSLLDTARLASCAGHLLATACWAQHVLLHVLVTYRLQLAGQSTSCFMCWSPTGYSLLCRARLASCAGHRQATACCAEHVSLHVLVTYRLQLAGQSTSCFMCWSHTDYSLLGSTHISCLTLS